MSKCPICDAAVKARAENPSFPFCGPRCKTIDLGKWVNEDYRVSVPFGPEDLAEEELASDGNGRAGGSKPD